MSDLPEIKKESQDIIKSNNLRQEEQKLHEELQKLILFERNHHTDRRSGGHKSINYRISRKDLTLKMQEIQLKMQEFKNINNMSWKDRISRVHIIDQFKPSQYKDIVILGLELIKVNLENKRRLKEIYDEYYSEDFIKELLSNLYEKEI